MEDIPQLPITVYYSKFIPIFLMLFCAGFFLITYQMHKQENQFKFDDILALIISSIGFLYATILAFSKREMVTLTYEGISKGNTRISWKNILSAEEVVTQSGKYTSRYIAINLIDKTEFDQYPLGLWGQLSASYGESNFNTPFYIRADVQRKKFKDVISYINYYKNKYGSAQ